MRWRRLMTLSIGTAVLLASWPSLAAAGDGRLEINQACALAGCFAGDTAGFPVQISEPGSYVLTSNLAPPGGASGVTTSAEGVAVDLNGFELRGPGNCSASLDANGRPTAITCSGVAGNGLDGPSRVHNGTIRGFSRAIDIPAGETLQVEDVFLTQNSIGIEAASRGLILVDSVISLHSILGVTGQSTTSRHTIRGCLFERNTIGVYLANGIATLNSFHQNREGLRSNISGQPMVVNNGFTSNVFSISGNDAAYQGNAFDNDANNPEGTNLGSNVCSGLLCP